MFRRCFFLILTGCFLLAPALLAAQANSNDFDKFYSDFKDAVARKDKDALSKMMTAHFDFFQKQNVVHEEVFKQLDGEDGKQWTNLQEAVKGKPAEFADTYLGKPARALQCTPTSTAYYCYVVFIQDKEQHWRWKGMIMPDKVRPLLPVLEMRPEPKK